MVTERLMIAPATILEWPQIEGLRSEYHARFGLPVGRLGREEARWFVAVRGERVLGCFSIVDALDYGQRWVLDFYAAEVPEKRRVLYAMGRFLYDVTEPDGLEILFHVMPQNIEWAQVFLGHGFQIKGLLVGGTPRFRAKIPPGGE